jgi:hypothetical protein
MKMAFVVSADGPSVDKEGILMKRWVCENFFPMHTTLCPPCWRARAPQLDPKKIHPTSPFGLEAEAAD